MKRIFTLVFCIFTCFHLYSQSCSSCIKLIGDPAHGFKQLALASNRTNDSDTTQPEIAVAAWTCDGSPCNARGLFKFDIGSIPAGAVITSANLYLYAKPNNINGQPGNPMFGTANTSLLQRVNTKWTVANTGWNNQPTSTTLSQKTLPQSSSNLQNYIVDVSDFVQFWVNKPDSNYGMMLKLQNEQYYNSMIFQSGQATTDSLKPRLEICYTLPSSIQLTLRGDTVGNTFKQLALASNRPNDSDTTQPEIPAAAWTCDGSPCNTRGLFKFLLNTIPSSATINSARLFLFAKPTNVNGQPGNPMFGSANTSNLQRVTTAWSVTGTGWNNQPSATTSKQKVLPQSTSNVQNYTVDVTDFVQFWVNKPDSNYGMLLKLENEQYYNSMIFYSGQAPNAALKPRLEICYTPANVLPLSIINFTAAGNISSNTLRWTIVNQQDLSTIEIERSLNGTSFNSINILKPAGNENGNAYYSIDANIKDIEKCYYRIKLVKKSGGVEYSNILVVAHSSVLNSFSVFPNPAKDYVQISFNASSEAVSEIKVQNVSGQVLYKQNVSLKRGVNSIPLSTNNLSSGIYIVSMKVNNEVMQQKLIVQ